MSITVRLYSQKELEAIKSGRSEYNNLITTFMNKKSFSGEEIGIYPYALLKVYNVEFFGDELIEVYATDQESLFWFLGKEYNTASITGVWEVKTTLTEIPLPLPVKS